MTDISSPCVKVCTLDPASGLCRGCGRTIVEIEGWMRYGAAERRRIMDTARARLASLEAASPGRGAAN